MKRLFLSCMVLAVLPACSVESSQILPEDASAEKVTICADISLTRTALGEKSGDEYPNFWSEGDRINIGGLNSYGLPSSYDGEAMADFQFDAAPSSPYYALYPASAYVSASYSGGTAQVEVPALQTRCEGSYDPSAYIMFGGGENGVVSFSSTPMTLLKITPTTSLYYDVKVSSIRVSSLGDEKMSGVFNTDYSSFISGGSSSYVEMSSGEAVAFGKPWILAIPAGTYASGIEIQICTSSGGILKRTASHSWTALAGVMQSTEFSIDGLEPALISSAAEKSSSTLTFTWTNGLGTGYDVAKAYTFTLYSDEACSTPVRSFSTSASDACWSQNGKNFQPKFTFGGLSSGTQYWFKAVRTDSSVESNVVSATTDSFTAVTLPTTSISTSAVNLVILDEDFSDVASGGDYVNMSSGANADASAAVNPGNESQITFFWGGETIPGLLTGPTRIMALPRASLMAIRGI